MFPLCLKGIRAGPVAAGPREARPPAPPAHGICAHRGGVSHANTHNFSLKLTTVSTARAGPLIWKRHFATPPAGQPPVPRPEPEPGRSQLRSSLRAPPPGRERCPRGPRAPASSPGDSAGPDTSVWLGLRKSFLPAGVRFGVS